MAAWYLGSTKWTAVTAWAATTAYVVGDLRRQLATPSVGNERVFRCTTAGTSGGAEPSWMLTKGSTTSDGSAVWTEVTGNSTYNWSAPHARLSSAFSWMAAGDDCYVSNNHAETQSTAMTLTSPGTSASPCRVICVSDAGSTPPASADLATTATITTTGNSSITINGFLFGYGLTIRSGSGASGTASIVIGNSASVDWTLASSVLHIATTGSSAVLGLNPIGYTQASRLKLVDSSLLFGSVSQSIKSQSCRVEVLGGSIASTGSVPTTLISADVFSRCGNYSLIGVDLSAFGSGKNLLSLASNSNEDFRLIDCKLGASVSIATGTIVGLCGSRVSAVNCDSSDTNYRFHFQNYCGTITQETTIVRTGGATDGTTAFSRKMVSTANSKWHSTLESPWLYFWNDATGSPITVAVECVTDGVTLTDSQCWVEAEALTTSGYPLGGFTSDRSADVLAAGANQASSSETWTTTGLSNPVKQTLSTSITPAEKGWVRARVHLARASTTVYVCPKVKSATTQHMTESGDIINVSAGSGGGLLMPRGFTGGFAQ